MSIYSSVLRHVFIIRPHHFLCLSGHKSAGYTPKHAKVWDAASKLMTSMPDIKVKVVEGRDALCFSCPGNKGKSKCNEHFVTRLDKIVMGLAGLENNQLYLYHDVVAKLRGALDTKKHESLCGKCHWWELCKDTFQKI